MLLQFVGVPKIYVVCRERVIKKFERDFVVAICAFLLVIMSSAVAHAVIVGLQNVKYSV